MHREQPLAAKAGGALQCIIGVGASRVRQRVCSFAYLSSHGMQVFPRLFSFSVLPAACRLERCKDPNHAKADTRAPAGRKCTVTHSAFIANWSEYTRRERHRLQDFGGWAGRAAT